MRAILCILLIAIHIGSRAENAKEYVGLVYPPLPSGMVGKGGALIKDSSVNGLWYLFVDRDNEHMTWLQREIGRTTDNGALWRVEDTLLMPTLDKGESVHLGFDIECAFEGKPDASIIAIGKWAWRENNFGYAHHIRLAWRVHPVLEKFEAISTSKVACELNEDRD